jgi:hypothetical protein
MERKKKIIINNEVVCIVCNETKLTTPHLNNNGTSTYSKNYISWSKKYVTDTTYYNRPR